NGVRDILDVGDLEEVKEEPVEIKDELIDNLAEFKQEETNADIYSPSTGNARQIDHTHFDEDKTEIEEDIRKRLEVPTNFKPRFNREKIAAMTLLPVTSGNCDFCDDPELPIHLSPKDQTSAQRFFATL
ncbi:hypothetical protein PMAYCL1PPCAC_01524, partial [Pristionchus mayeri]